MSTGVMWRRVERESEADGERMKEETVEKRREGGKGKAYLQRSCVGVWEGGVEGGEREHKGKGKGSK